MYRNVLSFLLSICIFQISVSNCVVAAAASAIDPEEKTGIEEQRPRKLVEVEEEGLEFKAYVEGLLEKTGKGKEEVDFDHHPSIRGSDSKTPKIILVYDESGDPKVVLQRKLQSNNSLIIRKITEICGFNGLTPNCSHLSTMGKIYAEEYVRAVTEVSASTGEAAELVKRFHQRGSLTMAMLPEELISHSRGLFNPVSAEQAFITAWATNQTDLHKANIALRLGREGQFEFVLIDSVEAFSLSSSRVWSFERQLQKDKSFSSKTIDLIRSWDLKEVSGPLRDDFLKHAAYFSSSCKKEEAFNRILRRLKLIHKAFSDFSGWTPRSFMSFFVTIEDSYILGRQFNGDVRSRLPVREDIPSAPFEKKTRNKDSLLQALKLFAREGDEFPTVTGSGEFNEYAYLVRKIILVQAGLVAPYMAGEDVDLKGFIESLVSSRKYNYFHDTSKPMTAADIWDIMGIEPVE